MSKNQKKILEMLVSNKINIDEACRLLFVVEPEVSTHEKHSKSKDSRYNPIPIHANVPNAWS
jgi:hypothetical protein